MSFSAHFASTMQSLDLRDVRAVTTKFQLPETKDMVTKVDVDVAKSSEVVTRGAWVLRS